MPNTQLQLWGCYLRNTYLFHTAQFCGFDYILNPVTHELHRCVNGQLLGPHNLAIADLGNFIGLSNVGSVPAHIFNDGTLLPILDIENGEQIGTYTLNKCQHCFLD